MKLMSVWIGGCVRARIWSSFEHVSVPPNGNKIEKLKIMKKSVNDDDEGNWWPAIYLNGMQESTNFMNARSKHGLGLPIEN